MLATLMLASCLLAAGVLGQKSSLMPGYFDHPCMRTCVDGGKPMEYQFCVCTDYFDHPCVRTCADGGQPMECLYTFKVESFQTMSRACYDCANGNTTDCLREHCVTANGFSRNIKTVNRGIPGPTVQVCEGDTIIVDVQNYFAMAEGVAIHWHGQLQLFTPHMDGVGMITQCPIQAFTSFQYKFVAMDPGTHFWHAHTGLQRGEGMFGSLIVRQPPSREPHLGAYDFDLPEHVITVSEWQNKPLVEIFTSSSHGDGRQAADAVIINGRALDPTGVLDLPVNVFRVEAGQRYRFRVINAGSMFCPIEISVDGHSLTLIASDGRAFQAFDVQSFDTYSAERYDFVLTADQAVDSYQLRATGLGTCEDLETVALIQYISASENTVLRQQEPLRHQFLQMEVPDIRNIVNRTRRPKITGRLFNNISVDTTVPLGDARDQIIGMNSLAPDDRTTTGTPDHQFIMTLAMRDVDNLHYYDPDLYPPGASPVSSFLSAQISRISNRLGPVSLLAQMDEVPEDMFCNEATIGEECELEWCECIHKVTARRGELVEMVFISPNGEGFTHPVHIHGYSYRVMAMERTDEEMSAELFREMDARGDVTRKLSQAPLKDTVPVINGGYTVIRFVADNPGVWFAHCHLAIHAEIGMSFVLEVLDDNGLLPPAPANFPRCGPFVNPPGPVLPVLPGGGGPVGPIRPLELNSSVGLDGPGGPGGHRGPSFPSGHRDPSFPSGHRGPTSPSGHRGPGINNGHRAPSTPGGHRGPTSPSGHRGPGISIGHRAPSTPGGHRRPSGQRAPSTPAGHRAPSTPGGHRRPSGQRAPSTPAGHRAPSTPGGHRRPSGQRRPSTPARRPRDDRLKFVSVDGAPESDAYQSQPLGSSDPVPKTVTPAWVTPLVAAMVAVIAALAGLAGVLYRQTKIAKRRAQPLSNSSSDIDDHFSASRGQGRDNLGLTSQRL